MNPESIRRVLEEIGVEIHSETDTHFLIMCPFHNNRHSPAATASKENGFLYCWGAGCGKRSSLLELVEEIKCWTAPRALRFVEKHIEHVPFEQVIEEIQATKEDMPEFDTELMAKWRENFENSKAAQDYIESRGISLITAKHFGIGYETYRKMVVTPMRDKDERLVGVIGRCITHKQFKNSKNLPSRKTLFNYNNARKTGAETVVIVESNFDALRAHQAGYPNVVATLGGTFSEYHLTQVNKAFNRVILGVDVDEEGEKFAGRIAKKCRSAGLQVLRIQFSQKDRLPHGAKDFGDCTDQEIARAIRLAEIYSD